MTTASLADFPARIPGACKNHPDWYVRRCMNCRRNARILYDRAAQKHIPVADQAIAEAKHALTRRSRDPVAAEHRLRLAVLADDQWGATGEPPLMPGGLRPEGVVEP